MKNITVLSIFILLIMLFSGCSQDPTRVQVCNLTTQQATVSVKPDNGEPLNIKNVAAGATSEYVEIPPAPGGTISGSVTGTNPEDIRYYALGGYTYLITLSAGDKPVLSWKRE